MGSQRLLRSKRHRALLWCAQDGRCALCGEPLPERWHGDHTVPWRLTHRTNVFEMGATCPRCNLQKGAKMDQGDFWFDFTKYFTLAPSFREQDGQVEACKLAASVTKLPSEVVTWLFQLVTGYGKTLLAYMVFAILRQRDLVDRMLVLVPTDDQRTQFADDSQDARALCGIETSAWCFENMARDYRAVKENQADVFVATYQQLDDTNGLLTQMLDYRPYRWLVVSDECHHLGESGKWAERQIKLPNVHFRLGLTATPERTDGERLLGFGKPVIVVSYLDAFREQVAKRVRGHIDNYSIDVDINGARTRLTTATLAEDMAAHHIASYSEYEIKRQVRYNDTYLCSMLHEALLELEDQNIAHPHQHQMIVFCMTCAHADYVCEQINLLTAELTLSYRAEWVGVGSDRHGRSKSQEENRRLVADFKANMFAILVQVGIAKEGFNVKRGSVLVFMHLINADLTLVQQIGRGLRRNDAIPFDEDVVAIFASADTALADIIRRMEAEATDKAPTDPQGGGNGRAPTIGGIPDLVLLDTKYDSTQHVAPDGVEYLMPHEQAFCLKYGIPPDEHLAMYRRRPLVMPLREPAPAQQRAQQQAKTLQAQTHQRTRRLAGHVMQVLERQHGYANSPALAGKIMQILNREWPRTSGMVHNGMFAKDFEAKVAWLQQINSEVQQWRIPAWILTQL